jgi:hypothetical protein
MIEHATGLPPPVQFPDGLLRVPLTCATVVETIRHSLFIFVTCSK